jgi:hypothetical protein
MSIKQSYFDSDTSPQAEAMLIQLMRQATPWQKMQMVAELNAAAPAMAMAGLRQRFPQADEATLRRHLADMLLGPELAAKAYGPHKSKPQT